MMYFGIIKDLSNKATSRIPLCEYNNNNNSEKAHYYASVLELWIERCLGLYVKISEKLVENW